MYKFIAMAGTFDRLHRGHRYFLSEAFKRGEGVVIGVTSDEFANEKINNKNEKRQIKIKKYGEREEELKNFLKGRGLLSRTQIVKIGDLYGPAIDKGSGIEAIIVTSDTLQGGKEVNRKRKELGLKPLELITVDLVKAEDKKRISSTRIRWGEIDREGRLYLKQFSIFNFQFSINDDLRIELKKPLGILIRGDAEHLNKIEPDIERYFSSQKPAFVITVGDEVTKLANEMGVNPQVCIFDFKVGRKEKYREIRELGIIQSANQRINRLINVENPAGYMTRGLVEAIYRSLKEIRGGLKEKVLMRVIGEEDLAGVPAVLLAPLGAVVLYGQPQQGIVVVEVTEEKKSELVKILKNN